MIHARDDYNMRRDRPYNGQPQTCTGTRGATEIRGVTFRDLRDCFVRAVLLSTGAEVIDGVDMRPRYEEAVTSWHRLDRHEPAPGALCEYAIIADSWSVFGAGRWVAHPPVPVIGGLVPAVLPMHPDGSVVRGFSGVDGKVTICDSSITYWRPAECGPPE